MPKGKTKIDFGEGECQYRFCDRPGKKFPKKKDKQAYCCDKHRASEWNLQHPRRKEKRDALAQVPMPYFDKTAPVLSVPKVTGREAEKLFKGGDSLKEKGQKQAIAHSNGFVIQMRYVAVRIAKERGNVSSDDLRAEAVKMGIAPHHPNVWGSIFNGDFEMTGRKKSTYKRNHAREIKVWALVRKEK
jgi:hypothetical protein